MYKIPYWVLIFLVFIIVLIYNTNIKCNPWYNISKPCKLIINNNVKSDKEIPKIIHQIWIGNQNKRPFRSMGGVKNMAIKNGYEYKMWTEENIPKEWMKAKAFNNKTKLKFVCDLVRLHVLYNEGGIYLDSDFDVVQDLPQDLFDNTDTVFVYENEILYPGRLNNNLIGSVPRSNFIKEYIDTIISYNSNVKICWENVGPGLITKLFNKNKTTLNAIVYPSYYFMPKHWRGLKCPSEWYDKVYLDHYWITTVNWWL